MNEAPPFEVRTSRLGPAFDLLGAYPGHGGFFFERDGIGVATAPGAGALTVRPHSGDAFRGLASKTLELLRSIPGASAPSPIAVGALPFRPDAPTQLSIPGTAVRRDQRTETWLIELVPERGGGPSFRPEPVVGGPRGVPVPEGLRADQEQAYIAAVHGALGRIDAGEIEKVVLARAIDVEADRELDPRRLLQRLRAVERRAFVFAAPTGQDRSLVGASPELLVSRHDREVRANPLAGSAPRSGDPEEDRSFAEGLLASAKDQVEHGIVVEAISESLGPSCERLVWDPEPVLRETANVWHLSTRFRGVLRDPPPTVLDLVAELHPTPAVCGRPTGAALSAIGELEGVDRGCYAGPVGWMNAFGDGEWALALRCAELRGSSARLFAGAGIVAGSVPEGELEETERKLRAFLDALRWG